MASSDQDARRAEYAICKKRGHQPSRFVTGGVPPMQECKWCGTLYWTESKVREQRAPGAVSDGE